MKKILFAMTAMLSISAAFVSCSDKEVFNQEAAEQAKVLETEKQYKEAFVKHFGEVNPDQSWDFSQVNFPNAEQNAQTRAWVDDLFGSQLPAPTWSMPSLLWKTSSRPSSVWKSSTRATPSSTCSSMPANVGSSARRSTEN